MVKSQHLLGSAALNNIADLHWSAFCFYHGIVRQAKNNVAAFACANA